MKLRMTEVETIKIAAVVGQQTALQHRIQHRHNSNIRTADMSGQTIADTPLAHRHSHNSSTPGMTAQPPTHHNTTAAAAWRPLRVSLSWWEASQGSSICRHWYGPETRRSASRGSGSWGTMGTRGSRGALSTCQPTASSSPTWRGTSASLWMTTSLRRSVRTVIEVSLRKLK